VSPADNPGYWRLIHEFAEITRRAPGAEHIVLLMPPEGPVEGPWQSTWELMIA
jgi:hypothetical protein